jgi:ABC-type sugar transport system ATPase subunit
MKLLEVKNVSKTFPGVRALSQVSFDLEAGELHCIVGENGAGKSTFIKIVSGALSPDSGEIVVQGRSFHSLTPHVAHTLGISAIYQENILVPSQTVAENIFLGRELVGKAGFYKSRETVRSAQRILDSFKIPIRAQEIVENLQSSEQQFVKIIRAIESGPTILIMDEPTATFDIEKINRLLDMIASIKAKGIGIIYISHHLEEIIKIADRITVLKDGAVVACHHRKQERFTMDLLAREMVGRPVEKFYVREKRIPGAAVFAVKDLKLAGSEHPVSLELREGEILGIAGLVGSGRTEIIRAIFGADAKKEGRVVLRGKSITPRSPRDAVRAGIGLLTEDRKVSGLCLNRGVRENISIVGLDSFSRLFLNLRKEIQLVRAFIQRLKIKTPSMNQEVGYLSGGNQQKVVLAKWLFKDVEVLIFDEPTIGIDVSTKTEIYKLMSDFVSRGKSIIMVSSEMPELISLSDRVLVIRKGELAAVLEGPDITEENLLLNSIGGHS